MKCAHCEQNIFSDSSTATGYQHMPFTGSAYTRSGKMCDRPEPRDLEEEVLDKWECPECGAERGSGRCKCGAWEESRIFENDPRPSQDVIELGDVDNIHENNKPVPTCIYCGLPVTSIVTQTSGGNTAEIQMVHQNEKQANRLGCKHAFSYGLLESNKLDRQIQENMRKISQRVKRTVAEATLEESDDKVYDMVVDLTKDLAIKFAWPSDFRKRMISAIDRSNLSFLEKARAKLIVINNTEELLKIGSSAPEAENTWRGPNQGPNDNLDNMVPGNLQEKNNLEKTLIQKMRARGVKLSEARAVASLMINRGLPARHAFKQVRMLNEGTGICGTCGRPSHTEVHVVDNTGIDSMDYATVWVHDDSNAPDHDAQPYNVNWHGM